MQAQALEVHSSGYCRNSRMGFRSHLPALSGQPRNSRLPPQQQLEGVSTTHLAVLSGHHCTTTAPARLKPAPTFLAALRPGHHVQVEALQLHSSGHHSIAATPGPLQSQAAQQQQAGGTQHIAHARQVGLLVACTGEFKLRCYIPMASLMQNFSWSVPW